MGMLGVLALAQMAWGLDYYVSSSGDDASDGRTSATAWRTVGRVNGITLQPGDQVLFEGGQIFAGPLVFGAASKGTPDARIVVTSYGTGRATIDGGAGDGVRLDGVEHFELRNINVRGLGRKEGNDNGRGIFPIGCRHLVIDGVEATGFQRAGIEFQGCDHLRITRVYAHDNGYAGISSGPERIPWSTHVRIDHCRAINNPGHPKILNNHSGSGIVLYRVNGGIVEYCEAAENGWDMPRDGNGPVGIWAAFCRSMVFQYNIAHNNKTSPNGYDGGGFDFDGDVHDSILQYNYSYDNMGAGYLLCTWDAKYPNSNNTVRYNISENDGGAHHRAGIHIHLGNAQDNVQVHNNVIFNSDGRHGVTGWTPADFAFRNNIFVLRGTGRFVQGVGEGIFQGNLYWNLDGLNNWDGQTNLDAWRAGNGKEMLNGEPVGMNLDPLLIGAGRGERITDLTKLPELFAYMLGPGSPCIDAGLDLRTRFGIDPGQWDFYRHAAPQGAGFDIGAHEFVAQTLRSVQEPAAKTDALPMRSFHVSPEGDDEALGTEAQPWRTVQRAIEAVRAVGKEHRGGITIRLRAGRYELAEPIRLDAGVSGLEGQPVVIHAFPGETPVLSGGQHIEGWTLHDPDTGIYRAPAPGFNFRQLYVNGRRAIRARHPNRENNRDMGPMLRLSTWLMHEEECRLRVRRSDLPELDWSGGLQSLEIVINRHWDQHRLRLGRALPAGADHFDLVPLQPDGNRSFNAPWPQKTDRQSCFLENVYALLDDCGEWYLDTAERWVYYKPYPGEGMATAQVYAPRLEQLLVARDASHIRIAALRFEHSTWLLPEEQGYVGLQAMTYYEQGPRARLVAPAAIVFDTCHHIEFEGNVLQHTGASGLAFAGDSHHNLIRGNVLRDISGNALHMNHTNDRQVATHDDEISHNYVYGYGRDYHGGVGLFLSYVFNTRIEHNRVFRGPYTGISLGWGWTLDPTTLRDNLVRFNDVHDVVEAMDDGGCLYTLSRQDGTHIFENHFHELTRSPWAGHHPHYSLYFDQGSMNMTAERNVIQHNSVDYFDGTIYLQTYANGTKNITLKDNTVRDERIIARAGPKPPHAPAWEEVDDDPPWVRTVWCLERDRIIIRFSEPIEPSSACDAANYSIAPEVAVQSVRQVAPDRVVLRVLPLATERAYTLHVRNVRDTSVRRNPIADRTAIPFTVGNVNLAEPRLGIPSRASARGAQAKDGHGSPAAAFDGNKNTQWIDDVAGGGSWLGYEFTDGRRYRLNRYTLHTPAHNAYDPAVFPGSVTLLGSNDGNSWEKLDAQPELKWSGETSRWSFPVQVTNAYSHYRLEIHRSVDSSRNRVVIANLELFGVVAPE
jgi:hypothetical protein